MNKREASGWALSLSCPNLHEAGKIENVLLLIARMTVIPLSLAKVYVWKGLSLLNAGK